MGLVFIIGWLAIALTGTVLGAFMGGGVGALIGLVGGALVLPTLVWHCNYIEVNKKEDRIQ